MADLTEAQEDALIVGLMNRTSLQNDDLFSFVIGGQMPPELRGPELLLRFEERDELIAALAKLDAWQRRCILFARCGERHPAMVYVSHEQRLQEQERRRR